MYREYIFENKKYEFDTKSIQAILFEIVAFEESEISSLKEMAESMDAESKNKIYELIAKREESIKKILLLSNNLSEALKELDSYYKDVKFIQDKDYAALISNIRDVDKGQNVPNESNTAISDAEKVSAGNLMTSDGVDINEKVEVPAADLEEGVRSEEDEQSQMGITNDDTQDQSQVGEMVVVDSTQQLQSDAEAVVGTVVSDAASNASLVDSSSSQGIVEVPSAVTKEESTVGAAGEKTDVVENAAVDNTGQTQSVDINAVQQAQDNSEGVVEVPSAVTKEESTVGAAEEKTDVVENAAVDNTDQTQSVDINAVQQVQDNSEGVVEVPSAVTKEESTVGAAEEKTDVIENAAVDNTGQTQSVDINAVQQAQDNSEGVVEVSGAVTKGESSAGSEIIPVDNSIGESASADTIAESNPVFPLNNVVVSSEKDVVSNKPLIPQVESVVQSSENGLEENGLIFMKSSNESPKAILTTANQIRKLRESRNNQESVLFAKGVLKSAEAIVPAVSSISQMQSPEEQIEDMMKQVTELYKEGKVDEAQQMSDRISEMNKQLQKSA